MTGVGSNFRLRWFVTLVYNNTGYYKV